MSEKCDYSSERKDFEVSLRFLSVNEGGRKTSWVKQGYRCDFSYANELDAAFMIWPIFLGDNGLPLLIETTVETDKPVNAQMVIIDDELRVTEHRSRIQNGTRFFMREGSKIVAEGIVTRIIDLFVD
jgi:translation elongation factor EF-Tu-like GTPase